MDALNACIPVSALVRLVISYTEPLEWWRFIPDIDERLALARQAGIEVGPAPEWDKCAIPPLTLNSRLALFGRGHVTFSSGDWECRGYPLYSSWWLRDTKSGACQEHRLGGEPAKITLLTNGKTRLEWMMNGQRHRDGDLAAYIEFGEAQWWKHDQRHRDHNRPAVVTRGGFLRFFEYGELKGQTQRAAPSPFLPAVKKADDGWQQMLHRLEEITSLARWAN